MIVGLKVGLTLGSSILASILDYYNYSADLVQQMPDTINGIKLTVSIFASIPFYLAVACLFAYSINKAMEQQIERDLTARRQAE